MGGPYSDESVAPDAGSDERSSARQRLGWGLADELFGLLDMPYDEFAEIKKSEKFSGGGALPHAVRRTSHGKREVAPLRCLGYAMLEVLTKIWTVIPFTLNFVHTPGKLYLTALACPVFMTFPSASNPLSTCIAANFD